MAVQLSIAVRNARLDALETQIGTSPKLKIYTGAAPASATAAVTGTKLVDIPLPSDWLAAAAAGSKAKLGTWSTTAIATGTAGYFRIASSATVYGFQGTCGQGSGDLSFDNKSLVSGQVVTIPTFTLTDANG